MKEFRAAQVIAAVAAAVCIGFIGCAGVIGAVEVFAAEWIKTVTVVNLEEPGIGNRPDYDFDVEDMTGFGFTNPDAPVRWYESEDGVTYKAIYGEKDSSVVFREGLYYKFEIKFTAEDGYMWYILGSGVTLNGSNKINLRQRDNWLVIGKEYGPLDYFHPDKITFKDLEVPEGGHSPDFLWETAETKGFKPADETGGSWYESSDGINYTLFSDGKGGGVKNPVFKANNYYRFSAVFVCDTANKWNLDDLTVTAEGADNITSAKEDRTLTVNVDFPKVEKVTKIGIRPSEDADGFFTREADTPIKAEVELTGASEKAKVLWYSCDAKGNKTSQDPIGEGVTVNLPGIKAEDIQKEFYVLVTATDPENPDAKGSAVITYKLIPDEKMQPLVLSIKGGKSEIVGKKGQAEKVAVEIANAFGEISVKWYRADSEGKRIGDTPYAETEEAELPALSEEDKDKVFWFEICAEDSRGEDFGASIVISYRLEEIETPTPTAPPTATPKPTEAPKVTEPPEDTESPTEEATADPSEDPGATADPSGNGDDDRGNKNKAGQVVALVFIILGIIALAGGSVFAGYLIGKKKSGF